MVNTTQQVGESVVFRVLVAMGVALSGSFIAPVYAQDSKSRSFEVFFEHEGSVITHEAVFVVREAVAYSKTISRPKASVTGHADTLGNSTYNLRLSKARARATRAALRANGLGNIPLTIRWVGESETYGPNDFGNSMARRAVIVIQSRD